VARSGFALAPNAGGPPLGLRGAGGAKPFDMQSNMPAIGQVGVELAVFAVGQLSPGFNIRVAKNRLGIEASMRIRGW